MNEQGTELLDTLNRLSLSSLSKSSPSTFQLKSTRLMQPPPPPLPTTTNNDKNKPSNLSHVPCKFFKQGTCTAGANCIFSHNPDSTSESSVCKYFRKGNCKFGTKCALLHTMSPYSTSSTTNNSSSTHNNNSSTTNRKNIQQQPSSFSSFNSASSRFLYDQFYAVNENYTNNDPFASSAPSPSPFSTLLLDERRSKKMTHNDSFSNKSFLFNNNNNSSSSSSNGININLHSIPENRCHHGEDDVNDFMLPSSLNDLLTPTELLQQLQTSNNNNNRQQQQQFEAQQQQQKQWNVPFYNTTNGTTSSSYSYDDSPPVHQQQQRYINIPSGGSSSSHSHLDFIVDYPDEDGPFIMEDTNSIDPTSVNMTSFNYKK